MMQDVALEQISEEKDLGVLIDDKLKFHAHVSHIVNKANQVLGILKRTFVNRSKEIFIPAYVAMVRSILEYANVIWHPRYIGDIKKVEKVQRRALKMVKGLEKTPGEKLNYGQRLERSGLYSLEYRRKRGDMIQVYRIMNGLDNLDYSLFFEPTKREGNRGHPDKVYKKRGNKKLRCDTFSIRVVDAWNKLPDTVTAADSLEIFKTRLDQHWSSELYVYHE